MFEISVQIFICGWWLCPELYLRRPFHSHASSRLDALLEAKAKEGVQVPIGSLLLLLFFAVVVPFDNWFHICMKLLYLFLISCFFFFWKHN